MDWIYAGLCGAVVGLAAGLAWEKAFGSGLTALVGGLLGTLIPIGAALYVVHYRQEVELKQHDDFVSEAVQKLYEEAQVMMAVAHTFAGTPMDHTWYKVEAQAKTLGEEIEVFQRHVTEAKTGKYGLRRAALRFDKEVTDSRVMLAAAKSGHANGLERELAAAEVRNAAMNIDDHAGRFMSAVGRELKPLSAEELEVRVWAAAHE